MLAASPDIDLSTIRRNIDIGSPRLPDDLARGQLETIDTQFTHGSGSVPLCQIARGTQVDTLTPQNSQSFKAAMIETFLRNETHNNVIDFYHLRAPLNNDDGFAFGPPQWTISSGDNRWQILFGILQANNMGNDEINRVHALVVLNGRLLHDRWNGEDQAARDTDTQLIRDVNTVLVQEGRSGIAILARYWHSTGRQPVAPREDRSDRGDHGDHEHGWSA